MWPGSGYLGHTLATGIHDPEPVPHLYPVPPYLYVSLCLDPTCFRPLTEVFPDGIKPSSQTDSHVRHEQLIRTLLWAHISCWGSAPRGDPQDPGRLEGTPTASSHGLLDPSPSPHGSGIQVCRDSLNATPCPPPPPDSWAHSLSVVHSHRSTGTGVRNWRQAELGHPKHLGSPNCSPLTTL